MSGKDKKNVILIKNLPGVSIEEKISLLRVEIVVIETNKK